MSIQAELAALPVQYHIIKIVGLLGDYPKKKRISFQHSVLKSGYREQVESEDVKKMFDVVTHII